MPRFVGPEAEFLFFLGPKLRDIVQFQTKSFKRSVGCCQHCGMDKSETPLEACHVHGKERKHLMRQALDRHRIQNGFDVDLADFLQDFKRAQKPLHETFIVLCKQCHKSYDTKESQRPSEPLEPVEVTDPHAKLPLTLNPEDPVEFKIQFLASKLARITIYYKDGENEVRDWRPEKFHAASNLIANLRCRPYFRKGAWQRKGITHAVAEVVW